jgi:hypothetical protein
MSVVNNDTYIGTIRVVIVEFLNAMKDGKLRKIDPKYAATQLTSFAKEFLLWAKFLTNTSLPQRADYNKTIDNSDSTILCHYET